MPDTSDEESGGAKSPQQIAAEFCELFEELRHDVESARSGEGDQKGKPPPMRVLALISDAQSLAKWISTGASAGEPRIAKNLVEVVDLLDQCGHTLLASRVVGYLHGLSLEGIAAENSVFGRGRIGPSK